jgi:hypothetical protein
MGDVAEIVGLLISMTSVLCPSPSAPVFTNREIQATRPPQVKKQTRNLSGWRARPKILNRSRNPPSLLNFRAHICQATARFA